MVKIRDVYSYDQEMSTPDVISSAASDLHLVDECAKLVGYFGKAKFIGAALGNRNKKMYIRF